MADDAPPEPTTDRAEPSGPSVATRFRRSVVRAVGIAAVALFTAFALANRQSVEFSWLLGTTEVQQVGGEQAGGVPLIVLLLAAFVLGAVVGAVFVSLRSRGRRRD